jgi:hypothetical protein
METVQECSKEWVYLDSDSREWEEAWTGLRLQLRILYSLTSDCVDECPETGEVWQYMGTAWRNGEENGVPGWYHAFRHRNHPRLRRRVNLNLRATRNWKPE